MVDEPIANQSFETIDDLEDVLFHRCQSLLQQPDLIRGLTAFHGWLKRALHRKLLSRHDMTELSAAITPTTERNKG